MNAEDSQRTQKEHALEHELLAARASGRRRPDFFVVGHAKCGTTALCKMLRAHPQIFMTIPKETEFLSRAPHHPPAPANVEIVRRRPRTVEAYLSMFQGVDDALAAGEGSTEYLRTPGTARRLAALCPDARVIAAFREPASFLRSLHLQLLEVKVEDEPDFGRALSLEPERRAGRSLPPNCGWPQGLYYSRHVRYLEQLSEYHECLGREQVLVLIYDDFRADNSGVLREVLRFLGVEDSVAIAPSEANPTVRVRSRRADKLLGSVSLGRGPGSAAAKRVLKTVTTERMRARGMRTAWRMVVDSEPAPTDEVLMTELRGRFRGEVQALGEYLQRDLLGLWGYDESAPSARP